jgi:tetratricopeptide (TPR) repeat protein
MFERSLSLYQKWEDRLGIAISLFHLAIIQGDLKADGEARSLLEKSLALFHQYGDWFYVARTSIYLGHLALKQGYSEQAIRYFEQQLQIDRELQFWDGIAEGYRNLGFVYHQQGVYDLAEQHYEQSLAIYREHGLRKTDTLYLSALLALQRDDFGLAYRRFSDFYVNTLAIQEPANLQIFFLGLAAVAAGDNQPERAAKLCGAAQMMIKTAGIQIPTSEQAEFERHLQIARKQLGEEIFAVLQTEGSAMSVEQAIALALS